ncbi:1,4-dihydroxy-2-naphthoate octaprenyltransferase [Thermosipho ferrireducens]|uniref:1,4-dihydroxy-2-naphthoate octaprenyltransferase n=1 Tax=Thermosipho ferrireducens TaxID=2571116 RepID=A0ABX7S709_9BACT|nr:1,4-dihydroxy-2-naphthoate octaprenyltransferase [Thermosipho ferrireducens]QTA37570.1 1,4-dihydroxy-2-naphthoate octaprenyltransferase [Thermosipho ferrireducens]
MKVLLIAIRPFSFVASFLPVTVGALLAERFNFSLYFLSLLAAILIHAGVNTTNDYFDFKKGVDNKNSLGSSGLLINGQVKPSKIVTISIVCYILGTLLGLYLVLKVGTGLIWYGIVGILFGYLYTGKPLQLKYKALGTFQVFILMGPLMVLGSYYVQTGQFSYKALLLSIPIGLMTDLILHANEIRDSQFDSKVGIKTLSIILGDKKAANLYFILVVLIYILFIVLYLMKVFNAFILLSFLVLPLYISIFKLLKEKALGKKSPKEIANVDKMGALAEMVITVIIIVSMLR